MSTDSYRRISLPPRSEYRFELDAGEALSVRLVPDPITGAVGDAEVFGAALGGGGLEKWHAFGSDAKAAISTWNGAEIEIAGGATTEYMADEPSPLYTYGANLHLYAEKGRLRAREQLRSDDSLRSALEAMDVSSGPTLSPHVGTDAPKHLYRPDGQGPRIMVVGPESAGKTTLIKCLANYALRSPAVASIGTEEKSAAHLSRRMRGEGEADDDDEGDAADNDDDSKPLSEITGWWPVIVALDPSEVGTAASELR